MPGTFEITQNQSDAHKFRGMLSFNGKPAEYYEVDLDVVARQIEGLQRQITELTQNPTPTVEEDIIQLNAEITSLQEENENTAAYINTQLQVVADADAERMASEGQTPEITVDGDGHLAE